MNSEIEAKFLNVDHGAIRQQLLALGATLEQPMRLMKRVVIHTPAMTEKNAFVRVRDEGHRTTVTYKQFDDDSIDGAKEYEMNVSDFDTAVSIFNEAGLIYDTYQESKRENWLLNGVEIMLDEWPWLHPYLEIEGESAEAVQAVAELLRLNWETAMFVGVANICRQKYPHNGEAGRIEINQNWPIIKFDDAPPQLLLQPQLSADATV
jgi:adenylate cyclase class 2